MFKYIRITICSAAKTQSIYDWKYELQIKANLSQTDTEPE